MNPTSIRAILLFLIGVIIGVGAARAADGQPVPRPGWRLDLLASAPDIRHPSVVCTAPDGRIFVAEDPMDISLPKADATEGRIVCLHPDGRRTIFADKLHAVFGLQYLEGRLYVLHNPRFTVFTDAGTQGTDPVDLIEQTNPDPWALNWNDHVPSNFRLAMDGYFYLAVGDKGLFGAVDRGGRRVDLHGGGVVRIRPDGTGLEIFSRGVRNILDVAINSEDELFTYDNTDEHEWMGRLTHMVDGGFYGYPFDFIPRRPYTLWMFADYGPGAACGALASTDDALPAEFHNNLFLADFGQRNLRRVILERSNGTFHAVRDELLFPNPPSDFRPVGIHETPDGRGLLICDWQHLDNKQEVSVGRLWRLTYETATNAAPGPDWFVPAELGRKNVAGDSELLIALGHPARRVRLAAQRELQRRLGLARGAVTIALESQLFAILTDPNQPSPARWHALWALAPGPNSQKISEGRARRIVSLLDDKDHSVVRQAIRWLGQHRIAAVVPQLAAHLDDTDPSIRFYTATALGRIGNGSAATPLLKQIVSPEGELWPRYAMFTALNRIGREQPETWREIVRSLDATNATVRETIGLSMRDTFDIRLAQALADKASDRNSPMDARVSALRLLASIHRKPPAWKGEWWAYHPYSLTPPAKTVDWPGTSLILPALRAALKDSDESLRIVAIEGLQQAGDRSVAPSIRAQASTPAPPAIRAAALRALGNFADPESVPLVVLALQATNSGFEVRAAALQAAERLAAQLRPQPPALGAALLDLADSADTPTSLRVGAIESIGRAGLTNAIGQLKQIASLPDPALRESAVRAIAAFGASTALSPLMTLARTSPPATQRDAIAALGSLRDKSCVALLLDLSKRSETREAAIAALTAIPDASATGAYLEALASSDAFLREKARRALRELGDTALPVIEDQSNRLSPGVRAELRGIYQDRPDVLAKPFLTGGSAATLRTEDYAKHALVSSGDPWRGQRIFFDQQRVACSRCHAVHGWGGGVGPELTTAGAQFGRAALIESILEPSKVVREGYQQVEFELRNGSSISGIVKAETGATVVVNDAEGRTVELRRDDILSRKASAISLMPEGLQTVLSFDEFADLVAYLESLKTDPRKFVPETAPDGFQSLLNGRDLSGWHSVNGRDPNQDPVRPPRHWNLRDGTLEHDGAGDHLWTDREFGDFTLRFDWRWVDTPQWEEDPIIDAEGNEARGPAGVVLTERILDSGDSGVFLRGLFAAQANLFCYPVGSGEFWELREASTGDARRSFTPRRRADRPLGQWNRMDILVRGDAVTVTLNGEEVISNVRIPGLPVRGPIGFQHEHGRLQIANLFVRELRTPGRCRSRSIRNSLVS